jgi:hypothetical protein
MSVKKGNEMAVVLVLGRAARDVILAFVVVDFWIAAVGLELSGQSSGHFHGPDAIGSSVA